MEEDNELLYEFLSESEEHLEVLNDKMLSVEESSKNNTEMSTDDLNTMFRSAHTIKGTASFLSLSKVVNLTHKAETLLQKLRDKEMSLSAEIVDALFEAFDVLTALLKNLKETTTEDGVETEDSVKNIEIILTKEKSTDGEDQAEKDKKIVNEKKAEVEEKQNTEPVEEKKPEKKEINKKYLTQFISEASQNIEDLESLLLTAEEKSKNIEIVNNIFRIMHTIKGSSGIVNVVEMATVSHAMENILALYREHTQPLNPETISLLLKGVDFLKLLLENLKQKQFIDTDISKIHNELNTYYKSLQEEGFSAEKNLTNVSINLDELFRLENLTAEQKTAIKDEITTGQNVFILKFAFTNDMGIKEMKATILEERLKKKGRIILMHPSYDVLCDALDDLPIGFIVASNLDKITITKLLSLDGIGLTSIEYFDNLKGLILGSTKSEPKAISPNINEEIVNKEEKIEKEIIKEEEIIEEKDIKEEEATSVKIETEKNDHKEEEIIENKRKDTPEKAPQRIVKGVDMVKPIDTNTISSIKEKATPIEISTIKIDSRKLDNLMNLSGELVIIRAKYARLTQLFSNSTFQQKEILSIASTISSSLEALTKEVNNCLEGMANSNEKNITTIQKIKSDLSESIETLKLKIGKNDIIENIHSLNETTGSLEKVSSDIQSGVMQTRMIPIEGVFTRFKRIVRDISKDINKEVNLIISGAETELDKKIVDSLGDPLTHMIRNAVDHGIEDAQTRESLGKPKFGTLYLKASHKGNSIFIEISDDGKGIDENKLTKSALKKGLLTEEQIDKMTDKEKLNIMFLPGFSTAEKVTGLSGRGVGMDVVINMISSLNGIIDIETKINEGTTFILKIPLTLAIIQSLLVSVNNEIYAFPLESVTEIIKVYDDDIYSVDGNSTVKLRNHALSLINLEKVIKTSRATTKDKPKSQKVVIISDEENRLGVVVDSLVGKDEIVIKPFTEHFANVKGLTGASILANGNVALILDPTTIIKESK